jgi:hypothetical protein
MARAARGWEGERDKNDWMSRLMLGLKLMVVVLVVEEEEEEEETQLLWLQEALNCRRLPRLARAANEELARAAKEELARAAKEEQARAAKEELARAAKEELARAAKEKLARAAEEEKTEKTRVMCQWAVETNVAGKRALLVCICCSCRDWRTRVLKEPR